MKYVKIIVFIMTVLTILISCETTQPESKTSQVTIYLSPSTNHLDIGPEVSLTNHLDEIYTVTASDNSAIFSNIPYGTYTVTITHDMLN